MGKGAKYTRGRAPLDLIHVENFDSRSDAAKREAAIKKLSRANKLKLIS
jgi:putative endonuclease